MTSVPTREWREIDKSAWPRGPWDDEPDRKQWQDEATGLPCLAVREPRRGQWCGYVGVSAEHPYFEKDYGDVPSLDVHGGLTYAEHCAGRICHEVEGHDSVWWLGFDCLHSGDSAPAWLVFDGPYSSYKSLRYVELQCTRLAGQLHAVGTAVPQ